MAAAKIDNRDLIGGSNNWHGISCRVDVCDDTGWASHASWPGTRLHEVVALEVVIHERRGEGVLQQRQQHQPPRHDRPDHVHAQQVLRRKANTINTSACRFKPPSWLRAGDMTLISPCQPRYCANIACRWLTTADWRQERTISVQSRPMLSVQRDGRTTGEAASSLGPHLVWSISHVPSGQVDVLVAAGGGRELEHGAHADAPAMRLTGSHFKIAVIRVQTSCDQAQVDGKIVRAAARAQ